MKKLAITLTSYLKNSVFWASLLALCGVTLIVADFMPTPAVKVSFSGTRYRVSEVIYQAPHYSMLYTPEFAPEFLVSSGSILLQKDIAQNAWLTLGPLRAENLSRDERYQNYMILDSHLQRELDRVTSTYRAEMEGEEGRVFLVMVQQSGDILVSDGIETGQFPHVRWLFRLEPCGGEPAAELFQLRTSDLRDDAAVAEILGTLTYPDTLRQADFLLDAAAPGGITVHLTGDAEIWRINTTESPAPFIKNAAILFSAIQNADLVTFTFDATGTSLAYTRTELEKLTGLKLWLDGDSLSQYLTLWEKIHHRLDTVPFDAAPTTTGFAALAFTSVDPDNGLWSEDLVFSFYERESDPEGFGEIAFRLWIRYYMTEDCPAAERIESSALSSVSVTPADSDLITPARWVVQAAYTATPATERYRLPNGELTGPDDTVSLVAQLTVQSLGRDQFRIVSALGSHAAG